jgi:hypothetical protein
VKRQVWKTVCSRRVASVTSAAEFCKTFRKESPNSNIEVLLSESEREQQMLDFLALQAVIDNAPPIFGISQDHYWLCTVTNVLYGMYHMLFG